MPVESKTHCQVEVLQEYFEVSATLPQLTLAVRVLFNLFDSVILLTGSKIILK
ncbi:MAG TPA: hypothetical protein P5241_01620 [Candidatus Paceibacterota bacterium]|nr:hypothetical protein [Candidatus Paceibacterota bacterium]